MNKELKPYSVHLICNAKYHDSDFARLEILKLLAEHDDIYTTVSDTYDNFDNHIGKNLVITYTCDLKPEDKDVKHMEPMQFWNLQVEKRIHQIHVQNIWSSLEAVLFRILQTWIFW